MMNFILILLLLVKLIQCGLITSESAKDHGNQSEATDFSVGIEGVITNNSKLPVFTSPSTPDKLMDNSVSTSSSEQPQDIEANLTTEIHKQNNTEEKLINSKKQLPFSSAHIQVLRISNDVTIYVGILGNSFAFLVLSTKEMREQSGTIFLRALSLFDTVFLLLFEIFYGNSVMFHSRASCKIGWFCISVVNTCSKYTLVLLNIDRFVAVFFPLKWKTYLGAKTRLKMLLALVGFTSGMFIYMVFTIDLTNNMYLSCGEVSLLAVAVETWLNLILNSTAAVFIAFFSTAISIRICCQSTKTSDMVNKEIQERNKQQARSVTLTLIVISMAYLILTSPFYIVDNLFHSKVRKGQMVVLHSWLILMLLMNHSIDFVLYAATGKQFRTNCKKLLMMAFLCFRRKKISGSEVANFKSYSNDAVIEDNGSVRNQDNVL